MRKDVAEDHLSFIESIGLYWINPASGADQGPWISHHSDDQTGHMLEPQGAQKLHDGAAAHSLEKAGGTSTTVSSGCLDKVMSSSEEMMMTMASQNHETGQIEELDFLSMLGLTKVGGGGGEAGSTSSGGQAKKWRLWQPEVSCHRLSVVSSLRHYICRSVSDLDQGLKKKKFFYVTGHHNIILVLKILN